MPNIAAILTAAGYSSRMGQMKALLPWNGISLIRHQINSLRKGGCSEIVVVLGHRSNDVCGELSGQNVTLTKNVDYKTGRVSSIKCGVQSASQEADCYVLLGVDQPRTHDVIAKLVESHIETGALITSPRFENKGGHPVIFSSQLRKEILSLDEVDGGLRKIFNEYRNVVNEVQFSDSRIHLDLNTYEDYQKALSLYAD
ncbi:MAG: nucleotidyltransferase family protein [SAR202 cluster bacterium]|mgnify:FL=1|nr:MAG: nucleotidyltransferase family protein [SAR202 cluster bacterium]MCH2319237.1 nucleotidyltransferase family protein [SAR202 cluster bacterium]MQF68488.1 nucleotidyltransferase family protein [SAR202 cluster bacterium AD-802-K11_MRT_200m]MQG75016.1 nucleotidyltransferase family protein [SAR202 cluster bacterium]